MTEKRTYHPMGKRLVVFTASVVLIVALNALLRPLVWRVDLTEDRRYTLSGGTRAILAGLDRPVTLKFYASESDPQVPMMLKQFARQVEELLHEYVEAGAGHIILEKHDPEPDSDAEDWARRYGVAGQALGPMGPVLYLGLVAVSGDREGVIPLIDPQQEELLEYHIDRLITGVTGEARPVIGVLSSLPVLPPAMQNPWMQQAQSAGWFAFRDLKEQFALEALPAAITNVPEHIRTLILIQPEELEQSTLAALDQFVLRGGHLLVFTDPLCFAALNAENLRRPPSAGGFALKPLLDAWGVTYDPQEVVADFEAATTVQAGAGQVDENPTWLTLSAANLNATNLITARLESILLPAAGCFTVAPNENRSVIPLITTSSNAVTVNTLLAQMGDSTSIRSQYADGGAPRMIGVQLRGRFTTAFPDSAAGAPSADRLQESSEEGSVTLVGDVDLLADAFCVRGFNFFGQTAYQAMNDNIALLLNTAETLSGNRNLLDVRMRARSERPFTVVQQLLREAQERFLAKEQELQRELQVTEQRLQELQSRKDEDQQFILSPRQQQEIERFRQQEYETRRQLKEVRRNLRSDIEALGLRIKLINILLMPVLVAAAGLAFRHYRKRKIARAA